MKISEKISKIKVHPDNPRLIKDVKFKKLVQSIKDFPEMLEKRPIIVNKDLVCLGGNMRLKAAREAGLKEVWIDVADWSEEKQKEFIIKDNSGFGEWDWDILANEWDQNKLNDWGLDLPPMFDEEIEVEEDEYTEPNDLNVDVVLGDLIQIGNHRLLCGDSTDIDQIAKLMQGEISHLSFTSPPYNAGKSEKLSGNTYTNDNKYNIYNDNQSQNDYLKMLIDFTTNTLQYSNYLICNIQSLAGNKISLIEYLYHFRNNFLDVAIWDKGHAAPQMANNVLNSVWEYLFFISSKEKPSRAIPNANFKGTVQNIYREKGQKKNEYSNIHAATFPTHLPQWAIQFTKKNDIILDVFLGTGSTMVAAHQLKRKCYGMELDPKYCQVIIDRMKKLDSNLEIKINGKPYEN